MDNIPNYIPKERKRKGEEKKEKEKETIPINKIK